MGIILANATRTSQKTHFYSVTRSSPLEVFIEILPAYSKGHIQEQWKQTVEGCDDCDTQNYWASGLCPSSEILKTRKRNVSEN
jgi:hypothetical protein